MNEKSIIEEYMTEIGRTSGARKGYDESLSDAGAAYLEPLTEVWRKDDLGQSIRFSLVAGRGRKPGRNSLSFYFMQALCVTLLVAVPLQAQDIAQVEAREITRFEAAEAGQGAAADSTSVYAIVNAAIGRYERETGGQTGKWSSSRSGAIQHLNSCIVDLATDRLLCANSNFPELPMASSIEMFDTETMTHIDSRSLGLTDGSLVWFDRRGEEWIAGFAHYDGEGGIPGKDHRYTRIVRYDTDWEEEGGWMLPNTVLERLAPHSASGGGIGPDGLLYLTGHDREEMYVLAFPERGPKLEHVATIDIDIQGQAFSWDRTAEDRVLWGISRQSSEVRAFRVPEILVERDKR